VETNPVYLVSEQAVIREYLDAYCAGSSVQNEDQSLSRAPRCEVITTFDIDPDTVTASDSKLLDYAISPAD
jgi:hypothetical protein